MTGSVTLPAAVLSLLLAAAATDAKTGLLTHAAWHNVAARTITARRSTSRASQWALLMIDLDHFAYLNDRYGHLAADELLRHVATALRGACGSDEILGRFGGDEFTILLPVTDLADLYERAEHLRRAVETLTVRVTTPFGTATVTGITISLGATLQAPTSAASESASTLTAMLWTADRALYDAKHAGRNTTRVRAVDNELT